MSKTDCIKDSFKKLYFPLKHQYDVIKNNPKVEGVIVVAKGVESLEMKQKISNALASLLGIASYKVQVFEK